jgi:hypothetical protein
MRLIGDFFHYFNIHFFLFSGEAKNTPKGRWGKPLSSSVNAGERDIV